MMVRTRKIGLWQLLIFASALAAISTVGFLNLSSPFLPHLEDPFLDAVMHGKMGEVERYVESGSDIFVCDPFGYSALTIAVSSGQDEIAKYLIDSGLNVDHQSNEGLTPLHAACYRGRTAACKLLLARGADPNLVDDWKMSPLAVAASKHEDEICEMLLAAGADPESANSFGCRPIHVALYAAANEDSAQRVSTIKVLLKHGVDVTNQTTLRKLPQIRSKLYNAWSPTVRPDETPMQIASRHGQVIVLDLLTEELSNL